jgi:hypothetical protein
MQLFEKSSSLPSRIKPCVADTPYSAICSTLSLDVSTTLSGLFGVATPAAAEAAVSTGTPDNHTPQVPSDHLSRPQDLDLQLCNLHLICTCVGRLSESHLIVFGLAPAWLHHVAKSRCHLRSARTLLLSANLQQNRAAVTCISIFDDDEHAVTGSKDRLILCWDLRKEKRVTSLRQRMGGLNDLALFRDE